MTDIDDFIVMRNYMKMNKNLRRTLIGRCTREIFVEIIARNRDNTYKDPIIVANAWNDWRKEIDE